MMRSYKYVGPEDVRRRVANEGPGKSIGSADDLASFKSGEPLTFVIDEEGTLRVADRHSEHVACAAGGPVLSAGEIVPVHTTSGVVEIVDVSNQSTGFCPEPESWPAVARALDALGIAHPGHFTYEAIFRRCVQCGQRNLVKEGWFECALCNAELPAHWNFDPPSPTQT